MQKGTKGTRMAMQSNYCLTEEVTVLLQKAWEKDSLLNT